MKKSLKNKPARSNLIVTKPKDVISQNSPQNQEEIPDFDTVSVKKEIVEDIRKELSSNDIMEEVKKEMDARFTEIKEE